MQVEAGVREAIAAVDVELALVTGSAAPKQLDPLRTSWSRLVNLLALGPPPQLRTCPFCGGVGMRAATRCSTCWKELTPPPDGAGAAPPSGGSP